MGTESINETVDYSGDHHCEPDGMFDPDLDVLGGGVSRSQTCWSSRSCAVEGHPDPAQAGGFKPGLARR